MADHAAALARVAELESKLAASEAECAALSHALAKFKPASSSEPRAKPPVAEDMLILSDEQVHSWRHHGYAIVDGFDVAAAREEASFGDGKENDDFGSLGGTFEFPTGLPNVDRLPIRLQQAARQLLGDDAVYISQADVWLKKPKKQSLYSNDNQRMHCDFGNNIVLPSEWYSPVAFSAIIYLDGPEQCEGGATVVVARKGDDDDSFEREKMILQPGYGTVPWINNALDAEDWYVKNDRHEEAAFRKSLYDREMKVMPRIGRILLYRLDIWHRGTPVTAGSRRVMNLVWSTSAWTLYHNSSNA